MLQIVGETDTGTDLDEATDDAVYCAQCGALVTRGRWRLSIDGHEHVFFNPAGIVFRILCFRDAPGVGIRGAPSDDFTWFAGYRWEIGFCAGCGQHLGWRFTGDEEPSLFFGLIKGKLTPRPGGGVAGG